MPLTTALKLRGIQKSIKDEIAKYDEVRFIAIDRYATKKEDGSVEADANGNAKFSDENGVTFSKEINELLATDVSVGTVSIADLGTKMEITVVDLANLEGILMP